MQKKKLFLIVLTLAVLIFIASCGKGFTVSFDSRGGSSVADQSVSEGELAEKPEAPTREGFVFLGWETESGELYDFSEPVKENIKLFARWEAESDQKPEPEPEPLISVSYHSLGKEETVFVKPGEAVTHPELSLSEGVLLDGWYSGNKKYESGFVPESDIALYASVYTDGLIISDGTVTGYGGESESVVIPAVFDCTAVTEIGERAFYESSVSSVSLPQGIELIGKEAFFGCKSLTGLELSSVREIGERAFYGCTAVARWTLPDSIRKIGLGAFGFDLVYEEYEGFSAMIAEESSLESISVPYIGGGSSENAFFAYLFGCESPDDNNYYDDGIKLTAEDGEKLVNLVCYLPRSLETVIVRGESTVPDKAFYNCLYLQRVALGGRVSSIGNSAFEGCFYADVTGLDYVTDLGERAFLQSGYSGTFMPRLETVGDYAFAYTDIEEIALAASVVRVGAGAFFACNGLANVEFRSKEAPSFGQSPFTVVSDGVTYYSDLKIWTYGDSFMQYRHNVNLYDYARNIYPKDVRGETGYIVRDGSLLGYIGSGSLETIKVPKGAKEIADFAFSGRNDVETVIMPEGLTRIGKYAFYNCCFVERLDIPSTLVEIDDYAFTGFFVGNNISRLYLPEGFQRIGEGAFMSSFNLRVVDLPKTLQHIGYLAFGMSNSLERMYFRGKTPPSVGSYENNGEVNVGIFSIVNAGKTQIYVPYGREGEVSTVDAYRSAPGFSDFAEYIKAMPNGKEVGSYGNGEIFIELDGCDTAIYSVIVAAEEDSSDMGGTRFVEKQYVGTYTAVGNILNISIPEIGSFVALYSDRSVSFTLNGVETVLREPKSYYDSYNWSSFRFYESAPGEGKGLFDMYGSFLTPFEYKISGESIVVKIDGNNKLPENSQYAGAVEYTGSYDPESDSFKLSFMLNDYSELMNFSCERNNVAYATEAEMRLFGTYKAYAESNPEYAMFTLVSNGAGSVDVYIGDQVYRDCKYTVSENTVTIDFQTLTLSFTVDKNGDLDGDFLGTEVHFVYEDELKDPTKLPGRDDAE